MVLIMTQPSIANMVGNNVVVRYVVVRKEVVRSEVVSNEVVHNRDSKEVACNKMDSKEGGNNELGSR